MCYIDSSNFGYNFYSISEFQPFPKQQILDSSILKELADDNFKSDKNGGKFFKQVENTV